MTTTTTSTLPVSTASSPFSSHVHIPASLESYLDRIHQIIQSANLAPALSHFEVNDKDLAVQHLSLAKRCIEQKQYKQALDAYSKACLYMNSIEPGFHETLQSPLYSLHFFLLTGVNLSDESSIVREVEVVPISTSMSQKAWESGDTSGFPLYPDELIAFLEGSCPIWPEKTASETHIVVPLFPTITRDVDSSPASVNLQRGFVPKSYLSPIKLRRFVIKMKSSAHKIVPRTLKTLNELAKSSGLGCRYIWEELLKPEVDKPAEEEFHWAVLTRDVLPGSRNTTYDAQTQLVAAKGYEMPGFLDAATAILWANQVLKHRFFSNDPWTYTRCKEKVQGYTLIVGGFVSVGPVVTGSGSDDDDVGVAGFRKF